MKNQKKSNKQYILIDISNDSYIVFLPNRFVDLLEFADETLHCKNVIINFDKARNDRAIIVKTFMFLGFHVLSPDNILMQEVDKKPDQLFMVYIIDGDE